MIRLFYTTVQAPQEADRPAGRSGHVKRLHEAAWSLLALSLHELYPDRFPDTAADRLPTVEKGPCGKPGFADASLPQFSLSHSGVVAVCAVSENGPVGVDVQETREMRGHSDMDGIVVRFFHPLEQEIFFSAGDPEGRRKIFYTLFSCKEAYVKMTGKGMSEDFRSFYTVFDENGLPVRIHDGQTGRILGYPIPADFSEPGIPGDHTLIACSRTERAPGGLLCHYPDIHST